MTTSTITNLTLRKQTPKTSSDRSWDFLSAAWVIDEIPGLTIQQRRPEDDIDGKSSWAIVSDLVLSWNQCVRQTGDLINQGHDYDSSLIKMYRQQREDIVETMKSGLPLADKIAWCFNNQRFPTRDDALQALDMHLFSRGTSL